MVLLTEVNNSTKEKFSLKSNFFLILWRLFHLHTRWLQSDHLGGTGESSADAMIQHMADSVERIYLALGYTDFRRQITGLTAMVALHFSLIWIHIPEKHCSVL